MLKFIRTGTFCVSTSVPSRFQITVWWVAPAMYNFSISQTFHHFSIYIKEQGCLNEQRELFFGSLPQFINKRKKFSFISLGF
jgi:hypothetical protein